MASIDETIAAIKTNRQARAAVGIAASAIRNGYDVIDSIDSSTLDKLLFSFFSDSVTGLTGVREQARSLLDRSNAYAGGIFATIRDDDQPVPPATLQRVQVVLENAESDLEVLEAVKADLTQSFYDELGELLSAILAGTEAAARYVAAAANKAIQMVLPTWLKFAIGGGLIVAAGLVAWKVSK